jgi:hypothetical protein
VLSATCALTVALALQGAPVDAPSSQTTAERPIKDLAGMLVDDVRSLPSMGTLLILGVGGGAALAGRPADDDLADWSRERGSSKYTDIGEILGDGWVQGGAAVLTYAFGVVGRSPTVTHVGGDLMRGQILAGVATRGLKLAVDRTRPSGGGHSFPSGHSSAAFVSASILGAHFGWKAGLPAYAAAGFIGWTRVRGDAHWLTDVIIGGTVGTIIGRTIAGGHGPSQWTIAPTASTTGAAVFVVKR